MICAVMSALSPQAMAQTQAQTQERSTSIVTIDGAQYYVHTVARGETLYGLSRLYDVGETEILLANPHIGGGLQEGQVIKIPVSRDGERELNRRQQRRTFDTHTVARGETLYAISQRYGVSVATLMEDNRELDPAHLQPGTQLNIRRSEQGRTTVWQIDEQMAEYRDAINSVTPDGQFYLVRPGDTLFSLARAFDVTVEELEAVNDLREGLKAGQLILIPGRSVASSGTETAPPIAEPRFETMRDSLAWVREQRRIERENTGWGERRDEIRDISAQRRMNVALLLPFSTPDGRPPDPRDRENFVHFYYGLLIGFEDLKQQGISADITVFDTARSDERVTQIVGSEEFAATDLIIGPVHGEGLLSVMAFAEKHGAPIVSPLQQQEKADGSAVLYQMAPARENRFDKLREMLGQPGINIIYINSSVPDADMDANLRPLLPVGVRQITYSRETFGAALEDALEKRNGDNVLIVSCLNPQVVDRILSHISSVHSNLVARSIMTGSRLRVVGNSAWARYPTESVDHDLYFKLQLHFVTNYHADRADAAVRDFTRRYIEAFGAVPTLFSYRGYDAAKLFGGALMTYGYNFADKVNNSTQRLLQMPYNFVRRHDDSTHRNTEWVLVSYGTNYIIRIE